LENHPTRNGRETRELCRAHVHALRGHACFRDSHIVLVPEANLGNEAQEISESLIATPGLSVLCQTEHAYGILTSPGTPAMYVFRLADKLQDNALCYHEPLVTANPFVTNATQAERVRAARKEFERQLRSFRRIFILPKPLHSIVRVAYTGKADKDNQRTNRLRDDMAMALLFGVYWSGQHMAGLIGERGYTRRFSRPETGEGAGGGGAGGVPASGGGSRITRAEPTYFSPVSSGRSMRALM
jgi:hypothetical protein